MNGQLQSGAVLTSQAQVCYQNDFFTIRIINVYQLFNAEPKVFPLSGRPDFHMALPGQWLKHHKKVNNTIAAILIINFPTGSGSCGQGSSGFFYQLTV